MKIWSIAIKDSGGNTIDGTEFSLQGKEYDDDIYEEGEEFGYYARGDNVAVALYQAGASGTLIGESAGTLYKGNGGYVYGRGTQVSVTEQGAAYTSNKLYISTGGTYRELTQTLYTAGSPKTYYKGDGTTGYLRGTSVTDAYYKGNAVKLQGEEYENSVFLSGGYKKVTLQGKKISKKLYEEGRTVTLSPAVVTTQDMIVLTA